MSGTHWQDEAVCSSADAELMTAETKPNQYTLNALAAICSDCPVTAQCARLGLRSGSGFYAGIWVPSCGAGRPAARLALEKKAFAL